MRSMLSSSREAMVRSRFVVVFALVLVAFAATAASALAAHQVDIVRQGEPPEKYPANTHYFKTIQAAVNATKEGDFVLIEPGTYYEEVKVEKPHNRIYIRGMNRNTVILDGQHKIVPGGSNGIEIIKANNVWVENLTVRNFDRPSLNGPGGNEIWWNGGADSGTIGAHGWYGSYLTAYDDGLNGGYGIYTNNERVGEWNNIYASGFNDSGIYLGACQECRAHITKATIENNAVGYSGSNSGGELTIEESIFKHNSTGIAPNGENPGDGPPPQDGECHRGEVLPPNPTPHIKSTEINRCTIIRNNLVTENNNLSVPANGSTEKSPFGAGIQLAGDYADLVEGNTITKNPANGVQAFEYPNPFPPLTKEEEEEKGYGTIYFQVAGNKIANNTFAENGEYGPLLGKNMTGAIFIQGGIFGRTPRSQSVNNCFSGNKIAADFGAATFPANLEETWGCQHKYTPNPENGFGSVEYLLELQFISEHDRSPEGQPVPPEQPTMPNPCEGIPVNPLCP